MKCPKCASDMVEIRQEDVYIDVCKECRGVFLDAGELEELLYDVEPKEKRHHEHKEKEHYHHDHHKNYEKHHHNHYDKHYYPKKKNKMKSILGDLFDF